MRKLAFIVSLVIATIAMTSCNGDDNGGDLNTIIGNGNVVTEQRHQTEFIEVDVTGNIGIELYKGENSLLEISAESNLIPFINIQPGSVGKLSVSLSDKVIINNTKPIIIKVFSPHDVKMVMNTSSKLTLDDYECTKCELVANNTSKINLEDLTCVNVLATVNGSGIIESNKIVATNIEILTTESGKIKLKDIEATRLTINNKTASDSYYTGTTENLEILSEGAGDVDAADIPTNTCSFALKSSGSIYLNVLESIEGQLTGSGDLYLQGDVSTENILISGTGELIIQP